MTICSLSLSSTSAEVSALNVPTNWLMKFSGEETRHLYSPKTLRLTIPKVGSVNWYGWVLPNLPSMYLFWR